MPSGLQHETFHALVGSTGVVLVNEIIITTAETFDMLELGKVLPVSLPNSCTHLVAASLHSWWWTWREELFGIAPDVDG